MRTRVCHIITKLELGGAQRNTLYTVANLDPDRFEAVLITGSEGPLVAEALASGRQVHLVDSLVREISPASDLIALWKLTSLLRLLRPEIVHTHSSKAGILGRWAAALAGVPHIVHSVHGFGFHDGQPRPLRGACVAAERLTGAELEILPRNRTWMIRSGIVLSDFMPRPAPNGGGITVGMVACMKPQKAPLDFVRVASRVVRADPRVRFVLVGDGEMRGAVERAIRDEGLESSVSLLGWRRDVPEILRGFDILLHTSLWEGLPRVFPEAMATGLPIVATRVDGAPEAIEEGVTGHLLDPGDVDGMALRILELAGDPERRRALGAAARERVQPWDIDRMVRLQEALYDRLTSGEPGGVAAPLRTEPAG